MTEDYSERKEHKVKKVYTTKNYDLFKSLIDNREVKDRTTKKIIDSIKQVGYVTNPVIVNEHYQVIDGQNRIEALRTLGLPVDYLIVEGAGIKHCRALNINQSNWTTKDWIRSYADGGNLNYKYLSELLKAFPDSKLTVIAFATGAKSGASPGKAIKQGDFLCDKEGYEKAVKALTYITPLYQFTRKIDGNSNYLECAIIYAFGLKSVNNTKLSENIVRWNSLIPAVSTLEGALDAVGDVYNYRSRSNKVYLKTEYLKSEEAQRRKVKRDGERTRSRNNAQRHL